MNHTISVLVENEFGVLTRVAALFSGRGFNIQSLAVAETLDPHISRMTIVTSGSDAVLDQIVKQLNKLVNVIKVQDITKENPINRILSLVKVSVTPKNRKEIIKAVDLIGGEIVDADAGYITVEFTGHEGRQKTALNMLKPYGIVEFVQTGNIAIQRGKKVLPAEK